MWGSELCFLHGIGSWSTSKIAIFLYWGHRTCSIVLERISLKLLPLGAYSSYTTRNGIPLAFWCWRLSTVMCRWGRPYLTRDFFYQLGEKMGDHVLLVVAEDGDELVAGALNLIGGDTLFGRLWGCHPQAYYPSLHFEACYYQVI